MSKKMKKGSPEAIAWGRRMQSLRKNESRKVDKPRKTVSVKTMSKKRSRKQKTVWHAIPDLFYAGSAVELAGPAVVNMYNDVKGGGLSALGDAQNISASLDLVKAGAIPAVELAIVGKLVQIAARKLGLSRIGTKEVKLF